MRKKFTILTAALALLAMLAVPKGGWGQTKDEPTVLFHETFGDNSGSARAWDDEYSVKSGVAAVYSGITGYTVTNVKQSKNTMGQGTSGSALVSSQGSTGSIIIGPLNVASYNSLSVTNYFGMSAASWNTSYSFMKMYYSTNNNTYAEVERIGSNPSSAVGSQRNYVSASYTLPDDAISSSLYLKFEFYCYQVNKNNEEIGQAYFDEVELKGVAAAPSGPTISVNPTTAGNFTYAYGEGPSEEQLFEVTLANSTSTIAASVPADCAFEISNDAVYENSVTLNSGDYLSVHMKAGLAIGSSYSSTLTLSSTGATDVTVSLTGIVTPPTHDLSQYSDNIEHGSISFSPQSPIEEGATVTLTATPDDGYELDSWTFYKEDGVNYVVDESITVENNTFTMPAYDLWVDATFTAKPTYAITCVSTMEEMASLFASPESAYQGQTVTLSYLTEPGCILSSIAITKTSDGSDTGITPTASGDNFTFTMPAYPVTVTATFVELHEASYIFNTDAGLQALGIDKPSSGSGTDLDPNHNYVSGIITMTCTHGSTATRVWNKSGSTELRVYNGGTLTFSIGGSGYCITKVRFEGTVNLKVGTTDVTNKQWIGNAQSITFTNKSSSSALATIIVEYSKYYTLDIAQHGADGEAGWYLIASPVASVTPSTSNGFLTENPDNYDLYRFNQDADLEWENYKAVVENTTTPLHTDFNALINGKGYLYANGEVDGTTLTFTGAPYNGNGEVQLYNVEGAGLAGWNLIGNPFGTPATIGNKPYYRMNYTYDNGVIVGGGNELTAATGNIAPMEGIFVHVSQDSTLTFSRSTTSAPAAAMVAINVLQEAQRGASQTIDRAIVRFGENSTLPKFQLNPNHTKLYIPQNGKDYAIVSAEGQGEMPVNFRANTDGQYTLTVNPEGVEMNYLHLIDNMTGNDVDLLATPSYTFNATTRDYESRFRLVFAANNENGVSAGSTTFAYFSNGNLVVNNEGNATLQVVDVMGRVVKSESINGSASINVNAAPGVYTLRLVNGNDVKTQKVVVR